MKKLKISNMRKAALILSALLLFLAAPTVLPAGDFDGNSPLICATIETVECGQGTDCLRGTAESINFPQFITIDFETTTISGVGPEGDMRTTKIEKMDSMDGKLILQGTQRGRGWSLVITKAGKMAISASDDQVVFAVFGACTPQK